MKMTTKHQSYLATCSKKHFKLGLLLAIAFTIVAFKIPIYSSEPQYIIKENYLEEEVWNIDYTINIQQVKTPPINEMLYNNIPPKLIIVDDIPDIVDSIVSSPIMDPNEFTLEPEAIIIDKPLPKIKKKVVTFADVMPQFIGGEEKLFEYIKNNIEYNNNAMKYNLEGKVYVRFIVTQKGLVENAEVVKGVHPLLDKAALKVVKNMPNWIAGKQNGENVNVYMVLPINFVLR